MYQLNSIIQIATASLVVFTSLALMANLKQGKHLWAGIGFTLSVFCYLTIETALVQESFIRLVFMTGSICVPVFFWLLTKSIFEDDFRFKPLYLVWFLLEVIPHFHHYLNCEVDLSKSFVTALNVINQIVSLGFVIAALYVAIKTRQTDLVEKRLKFRNTFIVITAMLIGVTLIVEVTPLIEEGKDLLQVMQRSAIMVLTGYFLLSNFGFQPGFFFREIPKPKPSTPADPMLAEQLMTLLDDKKIYRKEGLTIKQLAEMMQVQEHRLRRLINGQLDFKNFNDFLNQYRVTEACEILSDPSQNQKTILEIAYALGYQSIGPFNKAFKDMKHHPNRFSQDQSGMISCWFRNQQAFFNIRETLHSVRNRFALKITDYENRKAHDVKIRDSPYASVRGDNRKNPKSGNPAKGIQPFFLHLQIRTPKRR